MYIDLSNALENVRKRQGASNLSLHNGNVIKRNFPNNRDYESNVNLY